MRPAIRLAQPNFFLPFDRMGVDPFTESFPVTLRLEGTVRGTGGLRIDGEDCRTNVAGLYVAGDAASREAICGGFTGGGSHNAAWAISSGLWSGEGAAHYANEAASRLEAVVAEVSLDGRSLLTAEQLIALVQAEVFPYDRNYFRSGPVLEASLGRLDSLWREVTTNGVEGGALTAREAQAMLAVARWMYRAALARTESRGMHKRVDFPTKDPGQRYHLTVSGTDEITVTPRTASFTYEAAA